VFAGDFVHLVIGEKWRFAVPLIAVYAVNAALNQIGFNWTAFFRAVGDTKPIATANVIALLAVMAIPVPLLATEGLTAFGYGLTAATVIGIVVRMRYLRRIFPGLPLVAHVVRGIGPTLPAVAAVLAVRALDPGPRSVGRVVAEAALFTAIAIASTYMSEHKLLRESFGYLRGRRLSRAASAA
jgi:O-antigen/teichoic acid export membrane protein